MNTSREFLIKIGYSLAEGKTSTKVLKKMKEQYDWIKFPKARKDRRKDITGQRFEKLVALYPIESRKEGIWWKLQCDCGNFVEAPVKYLTQGYPKSCGCLNRSRERAEDITGKTYNFLKVLRRDETIRNHGVHYICQCELCGGVTKPISYYNITKGYIKSCGCLNSSGEEYTAKSLRELDIFYIKEYEFNDLKGDKKNLRFDFILFDKENNMIAIECQGIQHYKPVENFGGISVFEKQIKYDNLKRDYCKTHNIKLLEISWKDYDKIDKDYLLKLFTSNNININSLKNMSEQK